MAIKLNNCLEMTQNEFIESNINNNAKLKEAFEKNQNYKYEPVLPKPDIIYEKEFHFLEETLLKKEQRKERKQQRKANKLKKQEEQKMKNDLQENTL